MNTQTFIEIRKKHAKPELTTLAQALNWIAFGVPPLDPDYEAKYAISASHIGMEKNEFDIALQKAELQLLSMLRSGAIEAEGYVGTAEDLSQRLATDYLEWPKFLKCVPFSAWDSPQQIDWQESAILPEITLVNGDIITTGDEYHAVRLRIKSLEAAFPEERKRAVESINHNVDKMIAVATDLARESLGKGKPFTRKELHKIMAARFPKLTYNHFYKNVWPSVSSLCQGRSRPKKTFNKTFD